MWKGRKRYIERLHAFGMKAPGGRPRGLTGHAGAVERARLAVAKGREKLVSAVPAVVELQGRELSELTHGEALARIAFKGIKRLGEILSIEIPRESGEVRDVKVYRLVSDMAVAAGKMWLAAGDRAASAKRDRALKELLEEIRRAGARTVTGSPRNSKNAPPFGGAACKFRPSSRPARFSQYAARAPKRGTAS
jgi:hypothetical protein